MKEDPEKPVEIPCKHTLVCFLLVLPTTVWNKESIRDLIVSFTLLEEVANQVFQRVEDQIQMTKNRICSVETVFKFTLFSISVLVQHFKR